MYPTSSSAGPIGIVAALRQELSGLLALMPHGQCVHIGSREFWAGELDGSHVVLVLSRVGKVAAAATAAALAVEMEGAAVAQVCHEWGIPFAAVRIISDRADDSASVDFPRFIAEVESRYSVAIIRRWLGQVSNYPGKACPGNPSHISSKQERESWT